MRAVAASVGRWPVPQRASLALVAVGFAAVAVGLELALAPGWALAAVGGAATGIGLALERTQGD